MLALVDLNSHEREVVRECLHAAAYGPFFPESQFETIFFGLSRDQVKRILSLWPDVNESDEHVVEAINNSINNLLGYPTRNKRELWPKFVSVSHTELSRILDKWKGRPPRDGYKARDYFDDAM